MNIGWLSVLITGVSSFQGVNITYMKLASVLINNGVGVAWWPSG